MLALLFKVLLLSACAATPQSHIILSSPPHSLPLKFELSDTPFYPQTQYQCGPAALATLLKFYGQTVSIESLSKQMYIPDRQGSLQVELISTARSHNMLPYPLKPQLLDLLTEIAAGNPVLVLQNLGFSWLPQWHYAVVVGYDIEENEIILRSGTTKRWTSPFKVFERTWSRAESWGLALVPLGIIPKTAQASTYLKSAFPFEQLGRLNAALIAYKAATLRWPELATPWLAFGNIAFSQKDWSLAVTNFSKAAKLEPNLLTSWNNLAYALSANGCSKQANMALQCGLKISPNDPNLVNSWDELTQSSTPLDLPNCPKIECNL